VLVIDDLSMMTRKCGFTNAEQVYDRLTPLHKLREKPCLS
jgi:hypothetical protein